MNAGVSCVTRGKCTVRGRCRMKLRHGSAPGAGRDSSARIFFSRGSGSASAARRCSGTSSSMFTATTVSSGVRVLMDVNVSATLSRTIATRAPWSLNCGSSSAVV